MSREQAVAAVDRDPGSDEDPTSGGGLRVHP